MAELNLVLADIGRALQDLQKWMSSHNVERDLLNQFDKAYLVAEPYGTALIVSAWNYPIGLLLEPLVGAIAAGIRHTAHDIIIMCIYYMYVYQYRMYMCTCTIDAWAFKGTAMGYISMFHSEDLEVAQ